MAATMDADCGSVMSRIIGKYNKLFCSEEWNVGVVCQPIQAFLEPGFTPEIRWLPRPARGMFIADPFALMLDGRVCVACEEFDYGTDKGVISAFELSGDGAMTTKRTVLDLPFHLSYPYLLEYNGASYCIPETSAAREISLYKVQKFPDNWVKTATLVDGVSAVDSTVFQYEGRWWLAFTDKDHGPNLSLFIWHAPDLFGPWEPHAANPVKADRRSSRPGGTPFMHNGCLYRPAQDCTSTYGGAVVINKVVRLTPTEFAEEQVAVVQPDASGPFPHGLHTISSVGDITLIDGKRHVFIPKALRVAVKQKFSRCNA